MSAAGAHPPAATAKAALRAPLFVLYLWAFAYLTDLPLVLIDPPALPFGIAALILAAVAACYLSARLVRRVREDSAGAVGALWTAVLVLLASASAHDVARYFAHGLPPTATLSGFPRALLYALIVFAAAYTVLWAARRPKRRSQGVPAGGP